jgi:UDP-N-acetyl-D-glucosamine dehydrogenase
MELIEKINTRQAKVGVIGLGYVGLPLAIEFLKAGFPVTGFDVDSRKIESLNAKKSYIKHISSEYLKEYGKGLYATTDFSHLCGMDCILICVPTPLNKHREPDMRYVFNTARTILANLQRGQLIVLESTTYPGTTDEDMRSILEEGGLMAGTDFHLAFSPEREDPNNKDFQTSAIPKVVGGYTPECLHLAAALYGSFVVRVVPVSSTRVAEATKLLENIYRAVNIALVNELKILFDRMDIDIWETIEAAKTKPFGFQAFYPGPGLGGHCIPIDPFYLTWKARQFDFQTRFIEISGEINTYMPYYVVEKIAHVLNKQGKALKGSRILILGVAYKKDIDDQRESPALKIISILKTHEADVSYTDPWVPVCQHHRHYPDIDMKSVALDAEILSAADLVVLLTDHSDFDYAYIAQHAGTIVDTRDAFRKNGVQSKKISLA